MPRLLVGEIINAAAARTPDLTAVAHDGRHLSFAEVAAASHHVASVLSAHGVGRGDRVVWWGFNTVDAVPLFFATAHIGAVMVPVNPSFAEHEAKPLFELADASLALAERQIILRALRVHASRERAAEQLGISARTLRYKLARLRAAGVDLSSESQLAGSAA